MLRDADEEAVDDVEEEFQEEVQDDQYGASNGGLVDTDTREPEDGEGMEQTAKEPETQEALNGAQVERNKRKAIRIGGKGEISSDLY